MIKWFYVFIMVVAVSLSFSILSYRYYTNHPINKMYMLAIDISKNELEIIDCYQIIKNDTENVIDSDQCKLVSKYIATELNIIYESKLYDKNGMSNKNYYASALSILPEKKRTFIESNMTNNYYYYATSLYIASRCPDMVKKYMNEDLKHVMRNGKFDF